MNIYPLIGINTQKNRYELLLSKQADYKKKFST